MAGGFRSPPKVLRRLRLTRQVAREVRSWPSFMYHYAFGFVPRSAYVFRNGARLKISRGVDHASILEVFLKHDYGHIPDSSVILDVGASTGVFSIYAAHNARDVKLYAYEPSGPCFDVLQENVRLNGLEGIVTCVKAALASDNDEHVLFTEGTGFFFPTLVAPGSEAEDVQTASTQGTTLTNMLASNCLERVDVLKLDIEGGEYEGLYATPRETFDRISAIRMEYHNLDEEQRNVTALKQFLGAQGYRIIMERPTSATNGNLWAERDA